MRKSIPKAKRRTHLIPVRLSPEEYAALRAAAEAAHMPASTYARWAILHGMP
jgi:hypothetical protein